MVAPSEVKPPQKTQGEARAHKRQLEYLNEDARRLCNVDINTPFKSMQDVVDRLLPFHLLCGLEPDLADLEEVQSVPGAEIITSRSHTESMQTLGHALEALKRIETLRKQVDTAVSKYTSLPTNPTQKFSPGQQAATTAAATTTTQPTATPAQATAAAPGASSGDNPNATVSSQQQPSTASAQGQQTHQSATSGAVNPHPAVDHLLPEDLVLVARVLLQDARVLLDREKSKPAGFMTPDRDGTLGAHPSAVDLAAAGLDGIPTRASQPGSRSAIDLTGEDDLGGAVREGTAAPSEGDMDIDADGRTREVAAVSELAESREGTPGLEEEEQEGEEGGAEDGDGGEEYDQGIGIEEEGEELGGEYDEGEDGAAEVDDDDDDGGYMQGGDEDVEGLGEGEEGYDAGAGEAEDGDDEHRYEDDQGMADDDDDDDDEDEDGIAGEEYE